MSIVDKIQKEHNKRKAIESRTINMESEIAELVSSLLETNWKLVGGMPIDFVLTTRRCWSLQTPSNEYSIYAKNELFFLSKDYPGIGIESSNYKTIEGLENKLAEELEKLIDWPEED